MIERAANWLVLLHQIPPKPAYFRAKVQRRLKRLGALPVKNSVYLLPATDETLEDFQWLVGEIQSEGGAAWLLRSDVISGFTDASLEREFAENVATEYGALAEDAAAVIDTLRAAVDVAGPDRSADEPAHRKEWQNLRRRWDAIRRRDHFKSEAAAPVRTLISEIEQTLKRPEVGMHANLSDKPGADGYRAYTWVTRKGIKIDRIASAWLIRRFIDPAARFSFVDGDSCEPRPSQVRFDMFEGEFTHRGPLCTFEVLVDDMGIADPVLREIAQIVHDIDLKDDRYERPEAAGIAAVIDGLILREPDDARRLELGRDVFDALYEQVSSGLR